VASNLIKQLFLSFSKKLLNKSTIQTCFSGHVFICGQQLVGDFMLTNKRHKIKKDKTVDIISTEKCKNTVAGHESNNDDQIK